MDALGAAHFDQSLGGVAQRPAGIDHVVKEDAVLAGHIADDVHHFAAVGLLTALVHDGQVHVQLLGEGTGAGHGAHVGRNHHHVLAVGTELLGVVIHKDGVAGQIVHRDVKEALNLGGVQVHGQHTVGTGGGDHVGHQLGGDGIPGLGLAVLPCITEVGNHCGNASGGCPLERIDHNEQFHEIVVDGGAGRLDHKHIAAADRLIQRHKDLAVRERAYLGFTQLRSHEFADFLRQFWIGIAGKYLDILAVRNHFQTPSFLYCS